MKNAPESLTVGVVDGAHSEPLKACTKCGAVKARECFSARRASPDGLSPVCKGCMTEYRRGYKGRFPDKVREGKRKWAADNPDKVKATQRAYREAHKDEASTRARFRYPLVKERMREYARQWRLANPDKARERDRRWKAAHAQELREAARASRAANPEKYLERERARRSRLGPAHFKAARRNARARNPERVREVASAWALRNPNKVLGYRRAWADSGKAAANTRRWRALNRPAYLALCNARRSALKREGRYNLDAIRPLYEQARAEGKVVDHIYPIRGKAVSGLHVPANLRVIPSALNSRKSNKLPGHLAHELWDPTGPDVFHE